MLPQNPPKRAKVVLCSFHRSHREICIRNRQLSETKFLDDFWGPLPLLAPCFTADSGPKCPGKCPPKTGECPKSVLRVSPSVETCPEHSGNTSYRDPPAGPTGLILTRFRPDSDLGPNQVDIRSKSGPNQVRAEGIGAGGVGPPGSGPVAPGKVFTLLVISHKAGEDKGFHQLTPPKRFSQAR